MMVGKLQEPDDSDAMSGGCTSMPPRSSPLPDRPPVENCTIMPGQCLSMPSFTLAKRSGFDVVVWSSLRTCRCTRAAPASYASCVDSTCSDTVMGTAGLCSFFGTDPVIATEMMQGVVMTALGAGWLGNVWMTN